MDDRVRMSDTNRRRFSRFPLPGSVRLYSGTAMWQTELIDLSLRGVMVITPQGWVGTPGTRFRLDVRIEGGIMIGMGVELVRATPRSLAFSCLKIDLDSFSRLKRLVELNVGNTDILNRELATLGE